MGAIASPNVERVLSLFACGESHDAATFATFFVDQPLYQFGNFDLCLTRAAIQSSAEAFFAQIQAVYHDIKTLDDRDGTVLVEMDVHYWRLDGSHVVLPCADLFRVEGERFAELRIFMDVAPVFEPARQVDPSVSVFSLADGETAPHPHWMRWFFSKHREGRARVSAGKPPRWSLAGPRWPIAMPDADAPCAVRQPEVATRIPEPI